MASLPSGTVAFLMSDIEGSTRLVAAAGDQFPSLLDDHFRLLRGAIEKSGGTIVSTEGDSVFAVLPTARAAVTAAVAGQRALSEHDWPDALAVSVRMGIHVGEAVFGGRDYTGIDVHRAARVMATAWGGEILVTQRVSAMIGNDANDGASLRDLGVFSLRDIPEPEHLFQVLADGLRAEFPPPRTASAAAPTNLPMPLTRFVGRTQELAEVSALLDEARLVTLIGPGGTGKTRLAIEVGHASLATFDGGVFFVALEAVRDPDLVLPQIAQTLGLAESPSQPIAETLATYLNDRHLLLILDNLEQVIGVAPRIAALVASVPKLIVLGSSREPLGIAGEKIYAVPPLGLPSEPGNPTAAQVVALEAVQLFVERAQAARPDFLLTDENAPAVAAICRRVDGLPLAIELAAARANVLAPAQILERLDHRLTLLAGSRRDVTDRQRTLRGAIDWSYDLLTDDEKAAFRRFSVFAGGASLDAALAVIDPESSLSTDALDLLGALVGRSLLTSMTAGSEARFAMLETIREYALELLEASGERAQICDRHAEYFAALAKTGHGVLTTSDRDARLDAFEREMPNFRAMIERVIESGRADLAGGIALGLKDFWRTRNHLVEACNLLDRLLLEIPFGANEAARADVLAAASELASWRADYERARKWSTEQIEILERLGDNNRLSLAYNNVGWANVSTEPEIARGAFERAIEAALQADDGPALLASYQGLSLTLMRLGEPELARAASLSSAAVGERIGDAYTNSFNLLTLGYIDLRTGDQVSAARYFGRALRTSEEAGAEIGVVTALDATALLLLERGDTNTAARLAFGAERTRTSIGGAPSMDVVGVGRILDRVLERDLAAYQAAEAEAPVLTRDEAVAMARAKLAEVVGDRS